MSGFNYILVIFSIYNKMNINSDLFHYNCNFDENQSINCLDYSELIQQNTTNNVNVNNLNTNNVNINNVNNLNINNVNINKSFIAEYHFDENSSLNSIGIKQETTNIIEKVIQDYNGENIFNTKKEWIDRRINSVNIIKTKIVNLCEALSIETVDCPNDVNKIICARRCNLLMTPVWFIIKINKIINGEIGLGFVHVEGSNEFYSKTIKTICEKLPYINLNVLENLTNNINDLDLNILKPNESKMFYVLDTVVSTDGNSYTKIHPGLHKPLSLENRNSLWNILKDFIFRSNLPVSELERATENVLAGNPIPYSIFKDIIDKTYNIPDCKFQLLGFIIGTITCNPLIPYAEQDNIQGLYIMNFEPETSQKIYNLILECLTDCELLKRHTLRLLYAFIIRKPHYSNIFNEYLVNEINYIANDDYSWKSNRLISQEIINELNNN